MIMIILLLTIQLSLKIEINDEYRSEQRLLQKNNGQSTFADISIGICLVMIIMVGTVSTMIKSQILIILKTFQFSTRGFKTLFKLFSMHIFVLTVLKLVDTEEDNIGDTENIETEERIVQILWKFILAECACYILINFYLLGTWVTRI